MTATGQFVQTPGVTDDEGRSDYNRKLRERVRSERVRKGLTLGQMAKLLGIGEEALRKYETRSPLPQALIERFALATGRSIEWVVTGKDVARAKKGNGHPFTPARSSPSPARKTKP